MTEKEIYPPEFEEFEPEEPSAPPSIEEIEEELLHNGKWKEDAQQIPLDHVTPREAYLISSYLEDQLPPNDEEELKTVLQKYRPAIIKHDPQGTLENVEKNLQHNQNEKSFLQILRQQKKEKIIHMNYPLDDGSKYQLDIGVLRADSESIKDLQTNFKLFDDLTQREQSVRLKKEQGQTLTREEQIILTSINRKVEAKVNENQDEMITEFLAKHTYIVNETKDYQTLHQIYEEMDPIYRDQLYERVSRLSGLINQGMDELFQ